MFHLVIRSGSRLKEAGQKGALTPCLRGNPQWFADKGVESQVKSQIYLKIIELYFFFEKLEWTFQDFNNSHDKKTCYCMSYPEHSQLLPCEPELGVNT